MPLKARLMNSAAIDYTSAAAIGETAYAPPPFADIVLTDGIGENQAQKVFVAVRTIAASGTDDVDLSGGISDQFGQVIAFTKIRCIIVEADAANVNNVIMGNAPSNAFFGYITGAGQTLPIRPGDRVQFASPKTGYTVTPGTGDILRFANSAGGSTVTYKLIVIGF